MFLLNHTHTEICVYVLCLFRACHPDYLAWKIVRGGQPDSQTAEKMMMTSLGAAALPKRACTGNPRP